MANDDSDGDGALAVELRHWLGLLKKHHLQRDAAQPCVPGVIRILLIRRRLARLRDGTMEITVEGIEHLNRRA
jgi:hypothetical protein